MSAIKRHPAYCHRMKCSEIDAQNQIIFSGSVHRVDPKQFENHNEINLNVSVDNGILC